MTIDGADETYVAEIDQMFIYWAAVEAVVEDPAGEPVEDETVAFNGNELSTNADGTVLFEIESSYTDDQEITPEYGNESEMFMFDWESDGEVDSEPGR